MRIKFVNQEIPDKLFTMQEISVGREDDNLLQLVSDGISRHHGRIFCGDDNMWYIEDFNSTNGIFLNGSRVEAPAVLEENDIIDFFQEKIQVSELYETSPQPILATDTAKITVADVIAPDSALSGAIDPVVLSPATEIFTPAALSEPEPAVKTSAESISDKKNDLEELTKMLKQNTGSLFNKTAKDKPSENDTAVKKTAFSNKLFYVVLVCAIVVIGTFLIKILEDKNKPAALQKTAETDIDFPLYLKYIKENISRDNVFRFTLTIEKDTASFCVDDLKSQLRYGPVIKTAATADIARLKQVIKDSQFMKLEPVPTGDYSGLERDFKELEIHYGPNTNIITPANRPAPRDFMDIEEAINIFAESCDMATVSLSPEDLRQQAESNYRLACDRLANYETNLSYLKDAVNGFNLVMEYLSGVTPEPAIRKDSAEKIKRAIELRERWIKQYRSQYMTMLHKEDLDGAKSALQVLMSLYDENTKEYQLAKQRLIKIDMYNRKTGTKKKR